MRLGIHAVAMLAVAMPVPATLAQSGEALFEEVVVTARKMGRNELLQDVPLAVTAFGEAQLEAAFVRNVEDLSFLAPNVSLDSVGVTPGVQNFAIRGLGLNSSIPSVDPTVGVFVDEVYLGVTFGVVLDMFDLEAVEVLRGPQGLLFGRNVTGGAVLVRTKPPTGEFGTRFKAGVASGPEYVAAGSIEGPLSPRFAAKVTAYGKDDEGYFDNLTTGSDDYGAERTWFVRPSFLYTPTDDTELVLRLEHGSTDGDGGVVQQMERFRDFDTGPGSEGSVDIDWSNAILEVNSDVAFGNGKVTAILGWRDIEHLGETDVDGVPEVQFHARVKTLQDQWSGELRYSGEIIPSVAMTAGLYYFTQDILYREERILAGGALRSTLGGDQSHWTWAAFSAADVALTDAVTLNLGLRYTQEQKSARVATFNARNSPCDFDSGHCAFDFHDEHEWSSWIPKVGFQWRINPEMQLYSFWTKGIRSGGYNFRNVNPLIAAGPTRQEEQDALEAGFKSEWLQRRLRLNLAAFQNEITDLQREVVVSDPVTGIAQVIRNSADARLRGGEVEAVAAVTDRLTLTAAAGYTDAQYTTVYMDLTGDLIIDATDKELRLPRVSPWMYTAGLNYDLPLGALGETSWRVQYSHRDRAAFTDSNSSFVSAVDLLDASVTYRHPAGRLSFSLYGRNLTNEDYAGSVVPLPFGLIRYLNKGRNYGLEANFSF